MAYSDKRILRDADGNPIPQVWDPALGDFVPYEGKVQLSGNIVETLLPRQIRTTGTGIVVNKPQDIRVSGLVVHLLIHGVTGTFTAGQGVRMVARYEPAGKAMWLANVAFDRISEAGSQSIVFIPGASAGDSVGATESRTQKYFPIIPNRVTISIEANGSFSTGEGFDMEAIGEWL